MEQQKPDFVFSRPLLQEHKHTKTAAADGTHLRATESKWIVVIDFYDVS
jgi:hypothetical protein